MDTPTNEDEYIEFFYIKKRHLDNPDWVLEVRSILHGTEYDTIYFPESYAEAVVVLACFLANNCLDSRSEITALDIIKMVYDKHVKPYEVDDD